MKRINIFFIAIYFIIFFMSESVLAGTIMSGDGMFLSRGNPVNVQSRNYGPAQEWYYSGGQIRNANDQCLEVNPNCQFNKGCRVQLSKCDRDSKAQIWNWQGNKVKSGTNLCLDVHSPCRKENGCYVQVWLCIDNAVQQKWTYKN